MDHDTSPYRGALPMTAAEAAAKREAQGLPMDDPFRHVHRALTPSEQQTVLELKDRGLELWRMIDGLGHARDLAIAKTHLEDAIMRAVRYVTR